MREKWVDNSAYLGPDRRRVAERRRWSERRRGDEAGELPPLGALLRRVRVSIMSLERRNERDRALKLARGAQEQAERLGLPACAAKVRDAARMIAVVDAKDPRALARADSLIVEAMALVR
ncbi:MAG TPA: hypothetical protein VG841_05855 [Caulobacterales bacterium]|nr:hypothetical protein [Caulobacterales bacterium]